MDVPCQKPRVSFKNLANCTQKPSGYTSIIFLQNKQTKFKFYLTKMQYGETTGLLLIFPTRLSSVKLGAMLVLFIVLPC